MNFSHADERHACKQELRETLTLAWPLIIAQLAQMALFTTDVVVMGWLGPHYLAAGTLATAFLHPFMLFGIGALSAVAPLVAQAIGARDFKRVRRITRQGLWVVIAITSAMLPVLWQIRLIFGWLEQSPQLSGMAESYVHAAIWSLFPIFGFIVLRALLSAYGNTKAVLLITLAGFFVNAAGNYALVFGHWGFPRLELQGSGIATSCANLFMFLAITAYILRHRRYRRYAIFARFWKADWKHFIEILRLGSPIGLMLTAEIGMFTLAAMMMGWLGSNELAAHAVALQCAGIAFMVPLGLSQVTTLRVGFFYGAKDRGGIRRAGWISIILGLGFMACTSLILCFVPHLLVALFLPPTLPQNHIPFTLAVSYLGMAALFQLADGAQVVSAAALRGLSDTTAPMVTALFGYWAFGLPIAYLCGFPLGMGGIGIWFGLAAGLAFVAVTLLTRFWLREKFGLLPSAFYVK